MIRSLPAQTLSVGIVFVVVSLLPLHPETTVTVTPACPAAKAEMCRLKFEQCSTLHDGTGPRATGRGCAAEYAVLCRRCAAPEPTGSYGQRLSRLGPWWLPALPRGTDAWQQLLRWVGAPENAYHAR